MELELVKEDDDDDDGGDDDDDDENQLYQESFESRLRSVLWTQFLQPSSASEDLQAGKRLFLIDLWTAQGEKELEGKARNISLLPRWFFAVSPKGITAPSQAKKSFYHLLHHP